MLIEQGIPGVFHSDRGAVSGTLEMAPGHRAPMCSSRDLHHSTRNTHVTIVNGLEVKIIRSGPLTMALDPVQDRHAMHHKISIGNTHVTEHPCQCHHEMQRCTGSRNVKSRGINRAGSCLHGMLGHHQGRTTETNQCRTQRHIGNHIVTIHALAHPRRCCKMKVDKVTLLNLVAPHERHPVMQ